MLPKVLLADDHALVLDGLKSLLANQVNLVGTAEDGLALLESAKKLLPDVVVLDISMPVLNGIEAARQLRRLLPRTKLIFLSMHAEQVYIDQAMEIGASGFVLKQCAAVELIQAIHTAARGGTYVTPLLKQPRAEAQLSGEAPGNHHTLTRRQLEVLKLVAAGSSAKEIATALSISVKTAVYHKANLMAKLDLHTTADLVKYALRIGATSS